MDEPTASLSPGDTDRLLEVIRRLAAGGTTIVFVSHFLREVMAVCDDVTVLKDGRHVMTVPVASTTADDLVVAMIGRQLESTYPDKRMPAEDAPVRFAARGMAIILVSSEVEEVLGLAHRVAVMRGGAIVGELSGPDISKEAVMRVAFGSEGVAA
jgi:ABC-type sugar transport system ATPase subunit